MKKEVHQEESTVHGFSEQDVKDIQFMLDPNKKVDDAQVRNFLFLCSKLELDPRLKQIYPIVRYNKQLGRNELTTVTSIDGLRTIANKTKKYVPGRESEIILDDKGNLLGARVFVKKMTDDGTWHEISEKAYLREFMPSNPSSFWKNMARIMIEKVAEARALRRAFPDSLLGVYGEEEMDKAKDEDNPIQVQTPPDVITTEKANEIDIYLQGKEDLRNQVLDLCKVSRIQDIRESQLDACKKFITAQLKLAKSKTKEAE